MIKNFKTTAATLALIVITVICFTGCNLIPVEISKAESGIDTISEAWDIISREYVESSKINSSNMTRAAISGIIETLDDPYTTYLTPEEFKISQSSISGEFDGIGAVVGERDGNLVIVYPFTDSPAEKAGIRSGDTINAINGEPATGMNVDLAVSKIRGPKGTTVVLTILHEGENEPVVITVTRNKIEINSVNYEMRGDIAYINILQFTERTEQEFAPVIRQLKDANAKGIILDLRGNPGGLLDIVIDIASHFIPEGVIAQVRSNKGVVKTESAHKGLVTTDLPLVVLVDEFSASGSEVLSGALQDHNRALIAGNVTYGKGSVNYLYQLSDGSGLYITSSRWLTPDGRLIEGQGIEPDVKLELLDDEAIDWAIDYLHKGLH